MGTAGTRLASWTLTNGVTPGDKCQKIAEESAACVLALREDMYILQQVPGGGLMMCERQDEVVEGEDCGSGGA